MLLVDVLLLRQALTPLDRLVRVMSPLNLLRPGQRATGFEHSSGELLALAQAFNEMLERLEASDAKAPGASSSPKSPSGYGSHASCTTNSARH